ncbi:Mitochondrial chaperone BCS1 [Tetrabaena socialis]|uniref:Mitochondrial chaperone BCS1 n=1 Tax=Tetrabaena socialis TaxID=47790 RepID=A0A2J7ZR54_9CHLO|nr:Mitochondrial chaperone BCS1 [Tetrabaena socialis]|eukprot:PNH02720.1 Mitochondrial chaperone BCS1 [Tetrabaena socialis]
MEFSRRKLKSTRTLANVFLVADVERALDWYQLNGVPHTLGIMLHGPPGSGKTSTIKAIANKCKRHIVTVNLSCIASKDELYDIFTTDTVSDVGGQSVELPINRRLFVIEDIDCMLSVVLQRQFGQEKVNETKEKKEEKTFTLSDLLNVLDGLDEASGRLMVWTSNHPDVIDAALMRPGRIDLSLRIGETDALSLGRMVASYCGTTPDTVTFPQDMVHGVLTPAIASAIIMQAGLDPDLAVAGLVRASL